MRPDTTPEHDGNGGWQRPLIRLTGWIEKLLDLSGRVIAVSCLAAMFVALLLNVILRYIFGSGIAWAYEIHALLLPWLVAGGIVVAAAQKRNIAITLLPELAGPQARRIILIAIEVAIVVISISVVWSSQPILKAAQFQTLSTLGITQIWGYSSLIFAFSAMAVIAIVNIARLLVGGVAYNPTPGSASLS
ncbi:MULTISPECIES: TRAP transporter small permease [unclassified Yoonia]|uniref:TRAP transporter small permease n=1 Tax=unclassified Yoonia TaxID=2629118 RepID=UPI002AFE5410|nr:MULTISPECIES: TRAP transporter small permease [unclassified Yoonia]